MKVNNPKRPKWTHEPWTVIRTEKWGSEGLEDFYWYAYNTKTGKQGQTRASYSEAIEDIITFQKYAEPWGV